MNPSEDQLGITKNLIVSKALIENSRRLIKELEVLIKQRETDARRRKALLVSATTKEPPLPGGSRD
jgi:hypothetical protein